MQKISRPEDRGDNFAHLWRYYRIRIALQREHRSGLSGTVADKPYDVARLRYGRPCAQRHCEDNAAAKDSVAELRIFGLSACYCQPAHRLLQQRCLSGGVHARLARSFGRLGAAGSSHAAARRIGRGGISGRGDNGSRTAAEAGVATYTACLERGTGAAQRYAEHGGFRCVGAAAVVQAERMGRQDCCNVARCLLRTNCSLHRRCSSGAPA